MEISMYIILILAAAMVMIPVWGELVRLVGHLGVNYDGKQIPQSMGAVFPLIFLVAALWATATEMLTFGLIWRALVITIGLGTLGLVDDIWGDQQVKGIRGHFSKLLLRGEVTTGLLKAVAGFIVSVVSVLGMPGFVLLLLWRAIIVALSANLLNLLDLRPGRSLKGFFFLALLYVVLVPTETGILLLFPFLLTALVFFTRDLAGEAMLGDAGANVLGGVLGLAVVTGAPAAVQIFYFLLLVGFHVVTEKISLTEVIAKNSLLCFLDNLGRPQWGK